MLAVHRVRQPTGRLIFSASRAAFASAPQAKPLDKRAETEATSTNYPGFYDSANARVAGGSSEPVPNNDLLEATRTSKPRASDPAATATSTEKFAAGYTPLTTNSSLASTGRGLFQDAKTLNTSVSPGTPVAATSPPNAEHTPSAEREPPAGKSAFLRSISFGLPLFPTGKNVSAPVNITTTREHFLPLTRPSLIRLLATDSSFIDGSKERLLFHQLCEGFDSAVVQRYYPVLNELKGLFDPLNPDNETIDNRRVAYRDRLDNEYWLLQKINDLLHRANFTELPRHVLLDKFILHQDATATSNLNIKIDGYDYDVLKFWALGREQMPAEPKSRWRRLFRKNTAASPRDYFKRVVLAVRLKGHHRLYLKAFRDIPLASLTQLLPTGKLQIGNFEQQLLRLTALVGAGTIVTHLLTTMASYQIPGLLVGGGGLTLLLGLGSLRSFYQAKANYLAGMNRILFYKNVASNKQLLAMLVDRAEDELSKEVLLVYMFILRKQKDKGALTKKNLELEIENWIRAKANAHVSFSSDQSLEFLRKIGVLLPDDAARPAHLQVLPFEHVVSVLPKVSRTLSEKAVEWDLVEGYDKKHFEFDWKTVLNEDKLLHKGGWQ